MTSLTILITSFQSTLPARGATRTRRRNGETRGISIHAPRTGSDGAGLPNQPGHDISIHAPRTGSDDRQPLLRLDGRHFNPRSPHGERRSTTSVMLLTLRFQSTLPARGATGIDRGFISGIIYFNPRSPHGERLHSIANNSFLPYFNPRSPHGERPQPFTFFLPFDNFNPRSPHGERHAVGHGVSVRGHFNPRSPHGERLCSRRAIWWCCLFQSTLPARGATSRSPAGRTHRGYFNPRSPHGERRSRIATPSPFASGFQSTLPARGATR